MNFSYDGYPQPWRNILRGLLAAWVVLFAAQFFAPATWIFPVLIVIVVVQLGLQLYLRRR